MTGSPEEQGRETEEERERPTDRERDRAAQRRRRIAAAFGEALPERTHDENAEGWGERTSKGGAEDDDWLRGQVPPHHGD